MPRFPCEEPPPTNKRDLKPTERDKQDRDRYAKTNTLLEGYNRRPTSGHREAQARRARLGTSNSQLEQRRARSDYNKAEGQPSPASSLAQPLTRSDT